MSQTSTALRRESKLLEQRRFRSVALLEHRKLQQAEQAVVDLVHLRVAGEEHEGAAAGDLEQAADAVGGRADKLRRARIGQIGRDVQESPGFRNRSAKGRSVRGRDRGRVAAGCSRSRRRRPAWPRSEPQSPVSTRGTRAESGRLRWEWPGGRHWCGRLADVFGGRVSRRARRGAPRKPRRSIQKTVLGSSFSITKRSCTCNCCARRDQGEDFLRLLRKLLQFRAQAVSALD